MPPLRFFRPIVRASFLCRGGTTARAGVRGKDHAAVLVDRGAEKSAENSEGSALLHRVQSGKSSSCCHAG